MKNLIGFACILIGMNVYAWDYWEDFRVREDRISQSCQDEFLNIESKHLHKPVILNTVLHYKNWRAGVSLSNIPQKFSLMLYEAPWPERKIQMYIYNDGKKVAKINAALLSLGDREPIERWCDTHISDLFSPAQFKEIEHCSFEIVRKNYMRNVAIGYSIDLSIKKWFDKNFKIMLAVD